MNSAGRKGDDAYCAADAHSCSDCSHAVRGPALKGSPNVAINRRSALRVGDSGAHASCCGSNKWNAKAGAPAVLINGRRVHRMGDATEHCGGSGVLIQGSPDVAIGDFMGTQRPTTAWVHFRVLLPSGRPASGLSCTVKTPDGAVHERETDADGGVFVDRIPHGECSLHAGGLTIVSKSTWRDGADL